MMFRKVKKCLGKWNHSVPVRFCNFRTTATRFTSRSLEITATPCSTINGEQNSLGISTHAIRKWSARQMSKRHPTITQPPRCHFSDQQPASTWEPFKRDKIGAFRARVLQAELDHLGEFQAFFPKQLCPVVDSATCEFDPSENLPGSVDPQQRTPMIMLAPTDQNSTLEWNATGQRAFQRNHAS